MIKGLLVLEFL